MKDAITTVLLLATLISAVFVSARAQGQELNAPAPAEAEAVVTQGLQLVYHDKFDEAVVAFKKAIAIAPRYLKAHVEYVRTRAYFQEAYNDVRIEYESLMAKEPNNPIYPMALVLGAGSGTSNRVNRARYEKVATLAPEWAWGHYAKAQLLTSKEPEAAAAELSRAIEKDPLSAEAYRRLIYLQEGPLKNLDLALATAEMMAAQPKLRADGLAALWRLRMDKAQRSDDAKARLKAELDQLTASAREIAILAAVRDAYEYQLQDKAAATAVEKRILQLDPEWYRQRGVVTAFGPVNMSKVVRHELIGGRQLEQFIKVRAADDIKLTLKEQRLKLQQVLAQKPGRAIRRFTLEELFKIAEKERDSAAILKYGDELRVIDPTDIALLARMALVLADQEKFRDRALRYAMLADEATAEFRPMQPGPTSDPERFKDSYPEKEQRIIYQGQRALALEAHGWALCKLGKYEAAEHKLRQAVAVQRSERNLSHLAEALRKLGRKEEAEKTAAEARQEYATSITSRFINEPAKDFQLTAIDGRRIKLSDLKGKVVLINFWATWCGPCIAEMPHLVRVYEQYRDRGVEILAISTDTEAGHAGVEEFAKRHRLTFPVLQDEGMEKTYQVFGVPTTLFVDKQGNIRYRTQGFFAEETTRLTEVVLNELLK